MKYIILAAVAAISFNGCQFGQTKRKLVTPNQSETIEPAARRTVLVTGVNNPTALKIQAQKLGLEVSGEAVMEITGRADAIAALEVESGDTAQAINDERVEAIAETDVIESDSQVFYLAKKDFDLPQYWQNHPEHDGRGVIVGIIDDGVSPRLNGLQKTSTNQRKYLKHHSGSTLFAITLEPVGATVAANGFTASWSAGPAQTIWQGTLEEDHGSTASEKIDINLNEILGEKIKVSVFKLADGIKICVDANVNGLIDQTECFGSFSETGEYGSWTPDLLNAIQAEFDPATAVVRVRPGELGSNSDSHGEGVASVLTGYKIGGHFDGVAPGAQMLDYDLSEPSNKIEEEVYTIGTFVRALEWMGQNGANVCNISYSLFFHNAASQLFMRKALENIINRYNMVISFSAGNNGPGLGSFNRGILYPSSALVAGAFVSRDLDEYVHGVTGLPDPGRVVYYSSRGPAPDGGTSPVVISPLASLTHTNPQGGFGGFSGTSSASPALAGFATVLISAVKAEGLPFEAAAVTAAIRMSAVPLAGVPYIDQGAGLPKIDRALAAYRSIIAGKEPLIVSATVNNRGADGVTSRGIVLKTSQNTGILEYKISSAIALSSHVDPATAGGTLIPTDIEYTAAWISGPARSFLNIDPSAAYIKIDLPTLLQSLSIRGLDHTGEIKVKNSLTGQLLHVVPVTVIDDVKVDKSLTFTADVEVEDGKRFHLFVPEGVTGLTIKTENTSDDNVRTGFLFYDPNFIRTFSVWDIHNKTFTVRTPTPGWYQLILARSRGSSAITSYKMTVEPIQLKIRNQLLSRFERNIQIENSGSQKELKLNVRPTGTQLATQFQLSTHDWFEFELDTPANGRYDATIGPSNQYDVSYPIISCDIWLKRKSDNAGIKRLEVTWGGRFTADLTSDDAVDAKLVARCMPFEYSGTTQNFENLDWKFEAWYLTDEEKKQSFTTTVQMRPGINAVSVAAFDLTPNTTYQIDAVSMFHEESQPVTVGFIRRL